ncbi:peptidoglycan editing factor PgeF [Qipengyuania sphaerica]|uniref:peptidoglycan editing factor PgeF n=1 Tax=Qipengyuania sphaerica TaxID=2867243 RepID=UPI001C870BE7|nr:peptidoglycan editing factor PgeF [Qipengyuania sphaerica]MBX7541432.1 peptidoglycan editing factor PgeF [Qipengyuania sphaerica]
MAEWTGLIASDLIGVPHGFLTGPQSDRAELHRIGGDLPTVLVKQVHSPRAIYVDAPFEAEARPEADALVTDKAGLRLAIVTADCAPVLLADEDAGVVAAAHAGWRGAHGGVIEATLAEMTRLGAKPERIVAAIGPAIAQDSYEVDAGFRDQFTGEDERFFRPGREGHYQFDLDSYVAWRLAMAGVGMTDSLGIDTYANSADFHSYRRATHLGEPTEGRQISAIALPASE